MCMLMVKHNQANCHTLKSNSFQVNNRLLCLVFFFHSLILGYFHFSLGVNSHNNKNNTISYTLTYIHSPKKNYRHGQQSKLQNQINTEYPEKRAQHKKRWKK